VVIAAQKSQFTSEAPKEKIRRCSIDAREQWLNFHPDVLACGGTIYANNDKSDILQEF
jgi:hypothetical protein